MHSIRNWLVTPFGTTTSSFPVDGASYLFGRGHAQMEAMNSKSSTYLSSTAWIGWSIDPFIHSLDSLHQNTFSTKSYLLTFLLSHHCQSTLMWLKTTTQCFGLGCIVYRVVLRSPPGFSMEKLYTIRFLLFGALIHLGLAFRSISGDTTSSDIDPWFFQKWIKVWPFVEMKQPKKQRCCNVLWFWIGPSVEFPVLWKLPPPNKQKQVGGESLNLHITFTK